MASGVSEGPQGPLPAGSSVNKQGMHGPSGIIGEHISPASDSAKSATGPNDLGEPEKPSSKVPHGEGAHLEGLEATGYIGAEAILAQAKSLLQEASQQNKPVLATSGTSNAPESARPQDLPPHQHSKDQENARANMASPTRTDTSNEMEHDENQLALAARNGGSGGGGAGNSSDNDKNDSKSLRRLAQNREAARKSRLRKKAYVQQLESSRIRLQQLEQELQRVRSQGVAAADAAGNTAGSGAGAGANNSSPGAAAFDLEYARWVEEQHRQMCDLRAALQSRLGDTELRVLVDGVMAHYEELFRLKAQAAKADVFHLVSGMWKTPAERCFMWMGGFRPSELLKILIPQIEPLTEQQLVGICNLQQSSQQAEDALSQGMEALQQSLADTLSAGSLGASSNVANYMGQMAMAMGKLGTLESFVRQADSLRQQTLQQMHRLLTTRQAARGLLAMGDYFARLRALSSLWSARPRE